MKIKVKKSVSVLWMGVCAMVLQLSSASANIVSGLMTAFSDYKGQFMTACNDIVFPIGAGILAVCLVIKIIKVYREYEDGGKINWIPLAILLLAIVVVLSAKTWLWGAIGW